MSHRSQNRTTAWGVLGAAASVVIVACSSSDGAGAGGAAGAAGAAGASSAPSSCDGMTGTECQGENCCTVLPVPGGTFPMGRSVSGADAYDLDYPEEQPEHDVTVAGFTMNKYEVTVGRFRTFVGQYDGTPPMEGAGENPSVAGSGWQSAWNGNLPVSKDALLAKLKCDPDLQTWRDDVGSTEQYPMNCVGWYEAFAFCAWEGGRLPTEAEWEYAAAGGEENRLYPWGIDVPTQLLAVYDCARGGSMSCSFDDIAAVGSVAAGAGRWGHQDVAGNMGEWGLDWYDEAWYAGGGASCVNCVNLGSSTYRVYRGSSYNLRGKFLRGAARSGATPESRSYDLGLRCVRIP